MSWFPAVAAKQGSPGWAPAASARPQRMRCCFVRRLQYRSRQVPPQRSTQASVSRLVAYTAAGREDVPTEVCVKRIGMGLVGAGFVGPHHVDAVRRLGFVDLVAVAGSSDASGKQKAEALGARRGYGSYQALIDDPDVHVVHNATPNYLHAAVTSAALAKGKHVVSDKPLAMTAAVPLASPSSFSSLSPVRRFLDMLFLFPSVFPVLLYYVLKMHRSNMLFYLTRTVRRCLFPHKNKRKRKRYGQSRGEA